QVDRGAAGQGEALAVQLARQPPVEIEDVGGGGDVRHRLAHRHSHFQAHHAGQTVGIVADQTSGPKQRLLPELVVVDPVVDVAVERGASSVDGGASVLQGPLLGNGGDLADVCRILSLELSSARGLALFTVDDQGTVQWQPERVIVWGHESLPGCSVGELSKWPPRGLAGRGRRAYTAGAGLPVEAGETCGMARRLSRAGAQPSPRSAPSPLSAVMASRRTGNGRMVSTLHDPDDRRSGGD